jgi:hypothetical protein
MFLTSWSELHNRVEAKKQQVTDNRPPGAPSVVLGNVFCSSQSHLQRAPYFLSPMVTCTLIAVLQGVYEPASTRYSVRSLICTFWKCKTPWLLTNLRLAITGNGLIYCSWTELYIDINIYCSMGEFNNSWASRRQEFSNGLINHDDELLIMPSSSCGSFNPQMTWFAPT